MQSTNLKTKKLGRCGVRRGRDPFAALSKDTHPRTRREYIDQDYFDELSDKDKTFMSKFIDEYYGATLAPNDDRAGRRKDLHKGKKLRKECRDSNNRRNRDVHSLGKTLNTITDDHDKIQPSMILVETKSLNHEDTIIDLIDIKNSLKKD